MTDATLSLCVESVFGLDDGRDWDVLGAVDGDADGEGKEEGDADGEGKGEGDTDGEGKVDFSLPVGTDAFSSIIYELCCSKL